MMKSRIRKRTWQAIYRLLDRVAPVPFDCGMICGAVCCGEPDPEDSEMGIYLLPGEHKVFSEEDTWIRWSFQRAEECDFPESWHGKVYFIRCSDPPHCPREKRPLQCRTFPVLPHLTETEGLVLIHNDHDLPYCCPLIEDQTDLSGAFLKATFTVWKHLIRDPLIYDLVKMESADRGVVRPVFPHTSYRS